MLRNKPLYSYHKDAKLGHVEMNTGDFISPYTRTAGARPGVRTSTTVPGIGLQDGYIAPAHPRTRVMAVLSATGKNKVSRLVASEGQENVGRVTW